MPFKIVLIDDEPAARAAIKSMLRTHCPHTVVIGEAGSVAEGVALLQQMTPDLLMLDIEMEDGTGFDLLEQVKPLPCQLIFTTAHDEFAVRAFRCSAIDYLLKPINPQELAIAVNKARENARKSEVYQRIEALLRTAAKGHIDQITLHTSNKKLVFVPIKEIACVESCGNYSFVHLTSNIRYIDTRNLKEYEDILPYPNFIRTHQSFIVQVSLVRQWVREEKDMLVLATGMQVPVSRRRRDDLQHILLH